MKKKLSIIIPVYNVEKYLDKLLTSIVSQINENIELIIINDGSTDKSLIICEKYRQRYKDIVIKTIKNSGSGEARNVGINYANGEYLFFPDSDDELCENAINNILNLLEYNPDYVVFSYFKCYRNKKNNKKSIKLLDKNYDGNFLRKEYIDCLIPTSNIYLQGAPWNKVFKTEIVKNNDLKFSLIKRHQDDVFIINYMNYANKIITSSKPIYIYYQNMSYDESLKFPKDYFEIRKNVYIYFKKNIENWGENKLSISYLQLSFILALKRVFMLTYSKKWNMNSIERKECFSNILNDRDVNKILCELQKNINSVLEIIPNLSNLKKIYYRLYIKILKEKNYLILKIFSYMLYKVGNFKFFNK